MSHQIQPVAVKLCTVVICFLGFFPLSKYFVLWTAARVWGKGHCTAGGQIQIHGPLPVYTSWAQVSSYIKWDKHYSDQMNRKPLVLTLMIHYFLSDSTYKLTVTKRLSLQGHRLSRHLHSHYNHQSEHTTRPVHPWLTGAHLCPPRFLTDDSLQAQGKVHTWRASHQRYSVALLQVVNGFMSCPLLTLSIVLAIFLF